MHSTNLIGFTNSIVVGNWEWNGVKLEVNKGTYRNMGVILDNLSGKESNKDMEITAVQAIAEVQSTKEKVRSTLSKLNPSRRRYAMKYCMSLKKNL